MKQLLKSSVMLIASIMLFTAVVYAWFSLSNENKVQPISQNVIERNINTEIEYGINGGGYESFENPADLNAYLSALNPGDAIDIRVTIANDNMIGTPDVPIDIMLYNIRASETEEIYDLTDFFALENGTITLTWYASIEDYNLDNAYLVQDISVTAIDTNTIDYIGVPLDNYRLSNLFNHYMDGETLVIENNIDILDTAMVSQHIVVIEFSISFDPYTPDEGLGFQDGELLIDGLYTMLDEE
ncbi:MAG: hypothetical protein C4537_00505 [Acholeplasma sp.]|jgi:hypothetical protein|nr:MAG: hypothetical protein C4537_00505 [Acholeplasma sp.]